MCHPVSKAVKQTPSGKTMTMNNSASAGDNGTKDKQGKHRYDDHKISVYRFSLSKGCVDTAQLLEKRANQAPRKSSQDSMKSRTKLAYHKAIIRHKKANDRSMYCTVVSPLLPSPYAITKNRRSGETDDTLPLPVDIYTWPTAPYAVINSPESMKWNDETMLPSADTSMMPCTKNPHFYMQRRGRVENHPRETGFTYTRSIPDVEKKSVASITGMPFTRRRYVQPRCSGNLIAWI